MKKIFKKFFISLILIFALFLPVSCKVEKVNLSEVNNNSVDKEFLRSVILKLTDSEYQGRLAGSMGNNKIIEYIAEKYREFNLLSPENGTYLQNYGQKVIRVNETPVLRVLDNNGTEIKIYDYIYDFGLTTYFPNEKIFGNITGDTILLNEKRNYTAAETSGKLILVPYNIFRLYTSVLNLENSLPGAEAIILEYTPVNDSTRGYNYFAVAPNVTYYTEVTTDGFMTIMVKPEVFQELKSYNDSGFHVNISLNCELKDIIAANVVGYLEGNDETLKDEYIIISAHFDHVGSNGSVSYNPGAFDNGSGTAALLETARYLSLHRSELKKSVVFLALNGEEEGLYGSNYYVRNPLFPLSKSTVINLDMVGSVKDVPLTVEYCDDSGYKLRDTVAAIARNHAFTVRTDLQTNSDHAPFCKENVPAINIINPDFTGYHSPLDTKDNVDIDKLSRIIMLVLDYVAS